MFYTKIVYLNENHGRILIITSNYYDKIDKALIRPGRIDIKVNMTKASINTIKTMYQHYFNSNIPSSQIHLSFIAKSMEISIPD